MKILIFGEHGQLASSLKKELIEFNVVQVGSQQVSFLDFQSIRDCIRKHSPHVIINAAAYTAVDKAEVERDIAKTINADAIKVIAEEARVIQSRVIHFSTDYVFDGCKIDPYTEEDQLKPINYYGETKALGERYLTDSGCDFFIFRISWVYSAVGSNFVKTIVRLLQEKEELNIVNDQYGAPTYSDDIAQAIRSLLSDTFLLNKSGLYHMTPPGSTTWFDFAENIFSEICKYPQSFRIKTKKIYPISSQQYKTAALRPKNSILNSQKCHQSLLIQLPRFQTSLPTVIHTLATQRSVSIG